MIEGEWLPTIRELGSFALVAVVLLYLLREYVPNITKNYLDELSGARRDFTQALEKQAQMFEGHMRRRAEEEDARYARLTDCMRRLTDTLERRAHADTRTTE